MGYQQKFSALNRMYDELDLAEQAEDRELLQKKLKGCVDNEMIFTGKILKMTILTADYNDISFVENLQKDIKNAVDIFQNLRSKKIMDGFKNYVSIHLDMGIKEAELMLDLGKPSITYTPFSFNREQYELEDASEQIKREFNVKIVFQNDGVSGAKHGEEIMVDFLPECRKSEGANPLSLCKDVLEIFFRSSANIEKLINEVKSDQGDMLTPQNSPKNVGGVPQAASSAAPPLLECQKHNYVAEIGGCFSCVAGPCRSDGNGRFLTFVSLATHLKNQHNIQMPVEKTEANSHLRAEN
uniref:Uncharacterized protein n=1 Tax=Ditylenchus dipsaci TaxID=166011 RepID=A0A915CM83_9BILA